MKVLGAIVACFGTVAVAVAWIAHHPQLYLVAAFAFAAGTAAMRSQRISRFLQILITCFCAETVLLGLAVCAGAAGVWPMALGLQIPEPVVMTVALFAVVCHFVWRIPSARRALTIADRYFRADDPLRIPLVGMKTIVMKERTFAATAVISVMAMNQAQVFFIVTLSYASSAITDSLQSYDSARFWRVLFFQLPLYLAPLLVSSYLQSLASGVLAIRWREWLTRDYSRRWLSAHAHYHMVLAGAGADNPDQRIQEDIPRFIDGGGHSVGVYNLAIQFFSHLSTFVSFALILWVLSGGLSISGTFHIPGLLLWCAILYAAMGTGATAVIGRPLPALAFAQQHYEANFRFGLSRLREYSEQIALLAGEGTERRILLNRFTSIVRNFYSLLYVRLSLQIFAEFCQFFGSFIPYICLGAFFFAHKLSMGNLSQAAIAFFSINSALSFFISYYTSLAELRSVLDRLATFDAAIDSIVLLDAGHRTPVVGGRDFILAGVQIRLPDGTVLSDPLSLRLKAGENVLLTGPSGTGKSTLFRVIANVWPYWSGMIETPQAASVLVLPQKPYLPTGTLLAIVSYPSEEGTYSRAAVAAALTGVGLDRLIPELDADEHWTQRLSGGEQQRLAVARAVLARPTWLFLDEATAAMDMKLERDIYEMLNAALPDTTIVSIAHRESLESYHRRRLVVTQTSGRFQIEDWKASLPRVLDAPVTAAANE